MKETLMEVIIPWDIWERANMNHYNPLDHELMKVQEQAGWAYVRQNYDRITNKYARVELDNTVPAMDRGNKTLKGDTKYEMVVCMRFYINCE